jgi:plastocyanin
MAVQEGTQAAAADARAGAARDDDVASSRDARTRWRLLCRLLWRDRFDLAHRCFLIRLVNEEPAPTGLARIHRSFSSASLGRAAVAARVSAATSWRWDTPSPVLMVEDSVRWTWNGGPHVNIVSADQYYRPLPVSHRRYFSSGPPRANGTLERKFSSPGTYHFCCEGENAKGCRGSIRVQTEWGKAVRDLLWKEHRLVCVTLAMWLLLFAALELTLLWVSGSLERMAKRDLPPLTVRR